jgi:catechol 1,2-dioxygenase
MIVETEAQLTDAVLAVMARTRDPRQRTLLEALVRHLHAFVRETRLTEDEFRASVALINEIGLSTTDSHNETMLMAGSLGVSSLVCLLNNGDNGATETSQNLLGPFWRLNAPRTEDGASIIRSPTPGPHLDVTFTVLDRARRPIAGADVDIWHASPVGLYENQDPDQADMNLRGKFITDATGTVRFSSIKPAGYPIPTTGVVGRLLAIQDRHPMRPAHIHALIYKDGYKTLTSQVYADDDAHLATDVQFGVTRALTGTFERHDGPHPARAGVAPPWYSLSHTFIMEPGEARLPRPPIK